MHEELNSDIVDDEADVATMNNDNDPTKAPESIDDAVQRKIDQFTKEQPEGEEKGRQPVAVAPEESEVFPPKIYSSNRMPGARKSQRSDPRALDLRIEGLLFVTDVPLTGREISTVLEVPLNEVMETLRGMIKSFARRRSALELRERVRRGQPAFIIDLKPEYRPDVKPLARPALAKRYIETLALIALNQPLSQARLVRERGSKIYDHVRELLERGLVTKTRKGLSYELRTSPRFSSEFGVSSNPRDLKAMLARAMTDEERAEYDEYQEHQKLNSASNVVEESEAYEQAVEEAARSLSDEAPAHDDGEAVITLDKQEPEAEEPVRVLHELPEPVSKPIDPIPMPTTGRTESSRLSIDQLKKPAPDKPVILEKQDGEGSRSLTRFEKLFLKLKTKKS